MATKKKLTKRKPARRKKRKTADPKLMTWTAPTCRVLTYIWEIGTPYISKPGRPDTMGYTRHYMRTRVRREMQRLHCPMPEQDKE